MLGRHCMGKVLHRPFLLARVGHILNACYHCISYCFCKLSCYSSASSQAQYEVMMPAAGRPLLTLLVCEGLLYSRL